jgi:hypothetical protein
MDGERGTQVTDLLYVVARAALLDALDALGEQRDAVVLIGAQATFSSRARTEAATLTGVFRVMTTSRPSTDGSPGPCAAGQPAATVHRLSLCAGAGSP